MNISANPHKRMNAAKKDPPLVRFGLITLTMVFLGLLVIGPFINVFVQAFELGLKPYLGALLQSETLTAFKHTMIAAVVAVVCNLLFGVAAAWAISRFPFRGKAVLTTLIDLPFSVSPVIAGLIFVLLFGRFGYFGTEGELSWLGLTTAMPIINAIPGIVLATTFVTFPFVARELIPVLEALGPEEEEASRTLGASAWQMFRYVTLPNIKWGLLYGVLLCNARAIGEFGAVNVVSKTTDTLPIIIEKYYQGLGAAATASAFAVATLLTGMALITLVFKSYLETKALPSSLAPLAPAPMAYGSMSEPLSARPDSPGEDRS